MRPRMKPMPLEQAIQCYIVQRRFGAFTCGSVERINHHTIKFVFGKGHSFWPLQVAANPRLGHSSIAEIETLDDELYDLAVFWFETEILKRDL
jgi:hypothetical protein